MTKRYIQVLTRSGQWEYTTPTPQPEPQTTKLTDTDRRKILRDLVRAEVADGMYEDMPEPEDTERTEVERKAAAFDWLAKVLEDEGFREDIVLQTDEEDGVWVSKRDTGEVHAMPMPGQDAHAATLLEAVEAAMREQEGGKRD